MTEQTVNLGVLISGRGSNLEALLKKEREGYFERARIVCVVSDVPSARGLEIAQSYGLPTYGFTPAEYASKADYEKQVLQVLESHNVSYVVLAGYMRIVGKTLLGRFAQHIINIHPSLLPSFPGLHAQRQAVDYGVKVSGCTVHFVDSGMDTGPIIAQRAVPVMAGDDEDTLSERILVQEHQLYAESVKRVTETSWTIRGRVVEFCEQAANAQ